MMLICLRLYMSASLSHNTGHYKLKAHKWLSAVIARSDLRLVCVDEDSGMAERPTSTITDDCPVVSPFDCLIVHEFDGSMGSRLGSIELALHLLAGHFMASHL